MLEFVIDYLVLGLCLTVSLLAWHKHHVTNLYIDFCSDSGISKYSMDSPTERGIIIGFWIGVILALTVLWPVSVPMLLFED